MRQSIIMLSIEGKVGHAKDCKAQRNWLIIYPSSVAWPSADGWAWTMADQSPPTIALSARLGAVGDATGAAAVFRASSSGRDAPKVRSAAAKD